MSHIRIRDSADLASLRRDGYEVWVRGGHLFLGHVPYVNSAKQVRYGTLVSTLQTSGDRTAKPDTHVVYFAGEHPCNSDGSPIEAIRHGSQRQTLEGVDVDHSFSSKPPGGYVDYHAKMAQYVAILSAPARFLDATATALTHAPVAGSDEGSVFVYVDTNTSRANIDAISNKLQGHRIAIVGLGGTGAYVLDAVAKTPVAEIHLFDGDRLFTHNAFRAPGAPSLEELRAAPFKTEYFKAIYGRMHTGVHSHAYDVDSGTMEQLLGMSFVFVCIDRGQIKKALFERLSAAGVAFIDAGMALEPVGDQLIGMVRATLSTPEMRGHVGSRVSFDDGTDEVYKTNIQIAELNMLNASLAVIKWKKRVGFYQDLEREHNNTYCINVNTLANDDHTT